MCFDVTRPESLDNVASKWIPELRHFIPQCPIVLVGTKSDLRASPREEFRHTVPPERADALARSLGLAAYCETSALTQAGIETAFQTALAAALDNPRARTATSKRATGGWSWWSKHTSSTAARSESPPPMPPVMPETGRAPWIHPHGATLATDLGRLGGYVGDDGGDRGHRTGGGNDEFVLPFPCIGWLSAKNVVMWFNH